MQSCNDTWRSVYSTLPVITPMAPGDSPRRHDTVRSRPWLPERASAREPPAKEHCPMAGSDTSAFSSRALCSPNTSHIPVSGYSPAPACPPAPQTSLQLPAARSPYSRPSPLRTAAPPPSSYSEGVQRAARGENRSAQCMPGQEREGSRELGGPDSVGGNLSAALVTVSSITGAWIGE